jgi:micrococcal nuclease
VKGNVSQAGEKIYHEPGWAYYERTSAEECFESAADAEKAGYRASQIK